EQIVFLARAFRERGSLFLPLFTTTSDCGKTAHFTGQGVPAACLDLRRFRWRTLHRLLELLRRQRIDVIHWNFSQPLANSYVWWLTLLRPDVKHFYTDHNSRVEGARPVRSPLKRLCKRILLKRYHKVLCVSRFVQDALTTQGTWANLECCLHFINTERFQ